MPDQRNASPARVAAAIESARCGLRVIPLVPRDKTPLLRGWQRSATADVGVVEETWASRPDANIGIATGRGLLVVDADTRDAEAALRSLGLPDTTTVKTSKGRHYYLRGRGRNRTGVLPGLDIRGEGGYVVGAGSLHPSGSEYRWVNPPWEVPFAPVPPELAALLSPKRAGSKRGGSFTLAATGPIEQGYRNSTLFRLACSLRGLAGFGYDELQTTLTLANELRCRPPLEEDEVERIARSAAKNDAAPLWATDPVAFAIDPALGSRERHLLVTLAKYANCEVGAGPVFGVYARIPAWRATPSKTRSGGSSKTIE
jgi:putative DNA primase/helicase